ncbi:glycosyltransferase [Mycolicibacterium sp. CBM1]
MTPTRFDQAVVVVPAHNELSGLPSCLRAIRSAAEQVPVPVTVVVVLDACDDGSAQLAREYGPDVRFVPVEERNVGAARAAGFAYAREQVHSDRAESEVWYATTDADSRVDPNWLVRQFAAQAEVVLGVVRVSNWRRIPADAARRYLRAYHAKIRPGRGGHNHIHGANMGFTAASYWQVGGFAAQQTGEDVDLVRRFELSGCRIHRDPALWVSTSARRIGRAPNGFAAHLRSALAGRTSDAV